MFHKSRPNTQENFDLRSIELYGNKYTRIDPYINQITKLRFRCNNCGHEFYRAPYLHLKGQHNCIKCQTRSLRITQEEFESRLRELTSGNIVCIDEYKGSQIKLRFKCKKGHIFERAPAFQLHSTCGCPQCARNTYRSKLESLAEKILNNLGLKNQVCYFKDHIFIDCKYKKSLKFDFYIPFANTCIELDGEQHYRSVKYFGGNDELSQIQIRDSIKDTYCKNNNIKLIRIPYWEKENLKEIIENHLDQSNQKRFYFAFS